MIYASLKGRSLVMLGFGSIGPAVLPLILRHIQIDRERLVIIAGDECNRKFAEQEGVRFELCTLTPKNYREFIGQRLQHGDILLNLSVQVSCLDLMELCQDRRALYLDSSLETWPAKDDSIKLTTFGRRIKALNQCQRFRGDCTALIYHGANPGLVSHFAKQAILDVAKRYCNFYGEPPTSRLEWALLAQRAGVVALHIAERDSQVSSIGRSADEFVNTWSIDGFIEEAREVAGFAWGTHEAEIPEHLVKTKHEDGSCRAIELISAGGLLQVYSWVPSCGLFKGFAIPHPEAFSIAEFFSIRSNGKHAGYQPTVQFVYLPCEDALVSMRDAAEKKWLPPSSKRLLISDVVQGSDELGILVMRKHDPKIYWFGSQLSIEKARSLAPNNNATSLQVAAGILAGLVWLIENPDKGLVEPEEVDFRRALEIAGPYLGKLGGQWGNWGCPPNNVAILKPVWNFNDLAVNLL